MKANLYTLLFFFFLTVCCRAQDTTVVLSASMFDSHFQTIPLGDMEGWVFREGSNKAWAGKELPAEGWKHMKPTQLTVRHANKDGKVEGWFRLRFRLDSSFRSLLAALAESGWSSNEIYLDGQPLVSYNRTRHHGKDHRQLRWQRISTTIFSIEPETDHILAVHFIDHRAPLNPFRLVTQLQDVRLADLVMVTGPDTAQKWAGLRKEYSTYSAVWEAVCVVLSLLFCFLFLQNRNDKNLLLFAVMVAFLAGGNICNDLWAMDDRFRLVPWIWLSVSANLFFGLAQATAALVLPRVFRRKVTRPFLFFLFFLAIANVLDRYFLDKMLSTPIAVLLTLISLYFILSSRRSLKGAQWAVVVGFVLSTIWHILYVYNFAAYKYTFPFPFAYLFLTGIFLSTPLSMLVYVAMRFKEILGEVRENARRVVQLSEEKKQQALNQQKLLEEEVARQTLELRTALQNLKATQRQLIQQEKMASLGELTAGIAHEIQNPLNFVNNFSEANRELLQELETEAKNGNVEVVLHIAADLKTNEERIALHGKRAEAIVKSMMEHSKSTKGVKQSTDINALVEEYLKLAYHGFRAKHPSFSAVLETHYDPCIGKIEVVAQDIGRVLLNILNNAFYAVCKKKEQSGNSFEPLVSISTEKVSSAVVITVKDNGTGIPEKVKEKIYQPFFTTKPTGEGTGLGLSLSYDIITKGHGGNLTVQSTEGEGTEFIINLKGKEV